MVNSFIAEFVPGCRCWLNNFAHPGDLAINALSVGTPSHSPLSLRYFRWCLTPCLLREEFLFMNGVCFPRWNAIVAGSTKHYPVFTCSEPPCFITARGDTFCFRFSFNTFKWVKNMTQLVLQNVNLSIKWALWLIIRLNTALHSARDVGEEFIRKFTHFLLKMCLIHYEYTCMNNILCSPHRMWMN